MYGAPHHQHPPPPHPYYQDPAMAGRYPPPPDGAEGHYGAPPPPGVRGHHPPPHHHHHGAPPLHPDDERKQAAKSGDHSRANGEDDVAGDEEPEASAAVTNRLKTYIKPRMPSTQEVLDRRTRKNAQSRARASKLRDKIVVIERKNDEDKTDEEQGTWAQYEVRRRRKNDRSRERAMEKKEEIDRILAKPDKKRTKIEKQFLETALSVKKRKNEGDRLRRQRLKELGLSTKGTGVKPGISARGPLPVQYQAVSQPPHQHYGYPPMPGMGHGHGMGEIPMSPLPTMPPHHHPPMQSPNAYASPGMMPGLGFPSPSNHRRPHGTPVRGQMPYMPPAQGYDATNSPSHRGQGAPHASRVEQRHNPDGSMSISIGGRNTSDPSFGGEARMPSSGDPDNMNDLLLEGESTYAEEGGDEPGEKE